MYNSTSNAQTPNPSISSWMSPRPNGDTNSSSVSIPTETVQSFEEDKNSMFFIKKLELLEIKRAKKTGDSSFSIESLVSSSSVIAIATSNKTIIRYIIGSGAEEIELPNHDDKVLNLFMDPTGNHLFVSTTFGDFLYLQSSKNKFKSLKRFSGLNIEAIGWSKTGNEKTTGTILLGSRTGIIYQSEIEDGKELYFKQLYTLRKPAPIFAIEFEQIPSESSLNYYIMIGTSSPTCYYQFIGGNSLEQCFLTATTKPHEIHTDLPGSLYYGELHVYRSSFSTPFTSFALLLQNGIHFGNINYNLPFTDSLVTQTNICLYKEGEEAPLSMDLSQFHFLLLYPHSLVIQNKLNSNVVYRKDSSVPLLGISQDVINHSYWIYTEKEVYELTIKDEDHDVWRLYLDKAINLNEEEDFNIALEYAYDDESKDTVQRAEADYFFNKGDYMHAAKSYAETTCNLEEISLRFMDVQQRDALSLYLSTKADLLGDDHAAQKTLLCTWITEIYLDSINDFGVVDEDHQSDQYLDLVIDFENFLRNNKKYLDENTTYSLLSSHGCVEEMLYYAKLIEDYDRVLAYHIQQQDYASALYELKECHSFDVEELFYKYAPSLLLASPAETVDLWMSITYLSPCKLIPALVRYILNRELHPSDEENEAIRYLEFLVNDARNVDPAIHNYLLYLYAHENNDSRLMQFLEEQGEGYIYDIKYALRICLQEEKYNACIYLYGLMGLYEEAVTLALKIDIELAKHYANKSDDAAIQKKLWILIAKHLIEVEEDTPKAIALLSECDLKIEDILPFFPNFTSIDEFREPITQSIKEYNKQIDIMKMKMDDYTDCAQKIRNDIQHISTKYAKINGDKRCEICHNPVLSKAFYLFPCSHVFHADCLQKEVQNRKELLKHANNIEEFDSSPLTSDPLAKECPLCGSLMINSISVPIASSTNEAEQWAI
ncbi:hypothetical protein WA158_001126 [Blastocystis sp. Blastoise]